MDLWNRTFVAITVVLGALLCGVVILAGFLVRFPSHSGPHGQHGGVSLPNPQPLPAETRQAIALRTLELATARARILELEAQLQKSQHLRRELERQLRQIREQFSAVDGASETSLDVLSSLLEEFTQLGTMVTPSPTDVAVGVGEEPEDPGGPAPSDLSTWERQLELETLRTQVTQLQGQLEQLELEFDLELAELLFRKQEFGRTTAELFAQLGEAGVPILIEALESPEPLVRQWAADSLKALGAAAQAAIPYLSLALEDSDERVRHAARSALAAIRD